MSQYDNTNTGFLAANTRREKDTHPTHTGSLNVDGKEYWVSAWVNVGKEGSKMAGKKYFSIKLKPKDSQQSDDSRRAPPVDDGVPFNDDVPF